MDIHDVLLYNPNLTFKIAGLNQELYELMYINLVNFVLLINERRHPALSTDFKNLLQGITINELCMIGEYMFNLQPYLNLQRYITDDLDNDISTQLTHIFKANGLRIIGNSDRRIHELPYLPRLKQLECNNNRLTDLPSYPALIELDCSDNSITNLPAYPRLTELDCSDNSITNLPAYPRLTDLDCSTNYITNLSEYPELIKLNCYNNRLTSLPEYPYLTELYCGNNRITYLPTYSNLTKLYCSNNSLNRLPELPNLIELVCNNNSIKIIPYYPKLKILHCKANPLTHILSLETLEILNDIDLPPGFFKTYQVWVLKWLKNQDTNELERRIKLYIEKNRK